LSCREKYDLEHIFAPCSYAATVNVRGQGGQMKNEKTKLPGVANSLTRRRAIAAVALGIGGLASSRDGWGEAQQQAMKEAPGAATDETRTSLHQEVDFKASPQRIYAALLDSKQFAAYTGMRAEIDPKAGGAFSTFGGMIEGRTVELVPDQRIVQAWRPAQWDAGVYSIVRFELKPKGSETLVVLDHTGFPEGKFEHLNSGWPMRYWEPLKKFLA
jgi:activator of HSP90 ATPase